MLDSCPTVALLAVLTFSPVAPTLAADANTAQRAPAAQPSARERLAPLFTRATQDPAGVVPLILAASAELETLAPKDAALLGDTLEPFARRAFFTGERLPGMEQLGLALHKVEKGEVPTRIASRYKIGAGLIPYLNDEFDERKLRVGQELKVLDLTQNALELTVEKSTFRLFAWRKLADGRRALVLCVPVGLGAADSPTPVGTTTITKRVLHPDWTHPVTHKVYKDGDPDNVLGGYWVALDPAGIGKNGIGLHGYTGDVAANWIERGASNGCVRMLQNDIDRVFHLALEGTRIELRDSTPH